MPGVLRGIIAYLEPGGFLGDEFMQAIANAGIRVQAVCRYREHVLIRPDFAQRRSAHPAEGPVVRVGRRGLECRHIGFSGEKPKGLLGHQDEGAGADLAAPGAVARHHHLRPLEKREPDGATTAASLYHLPLPRCLAGHRLLDRPARIDTVPHPC